MTNAKLPYKIYTALVSQSGTSEPSVTILNNTIGNLVWGRDDTGLYTLNAFDDAIQAITTFPQLKTFIQITQISNYIARLYHAGNNLLELTTTTNAGVPNDSALIRNSIEIRVYK